MDEQCVRSFWQQHPCGDAQVGWLDDRFGGDYERFFTDYDRFRYRNEHRRLDDRRGALIGATPG